MEFNPLEHLIALHLTGSQAYGMATKDSDIDIGGVLIPPKEYFLGFTKTFNQTQDISSVLDKFADRLQNDKVEGTIYGLHKFMKLCADCNPNMIERLWIEPEDFLLVSPEFEKLIEIRDAFLSTKAKFTFSGYAVSQIHRIKRHRKWLLNPLKKKPTREDYNLPEIKSSQFDVAKTLIQHEIDQWAFHDLELSPEQTFEIKGRAKEQFSYILASLKLNLKPEDYDIEDDLIVVRAAMEKIGFDDNLTLLLENEYKYRNALTHFKQYENWKKNRNEARAELEVKYGFDSKHGSHVVRLLRMGEEILSEGKVIVKRPDAEELLAIRRGAWDYDQLVEYADEMQKRMDELYKTSSLRKRPDLKLIEKVCIELVEEKIK